MTSTPTPTLAEASASARRTSRRTSSGSRSSRACSGSRPTTSTCTSSTIRACGAALGPAIGGTGHGDLAMRARPSLSSLQIIYNLLEQDPGRRFVPIARELDISLLVRVPHSSGLLEGKYTAETTFPASDHRSHRPREWLLDGLRKLEQLEFLHRDRGMTLGQAALKWLLAEPTVASIQPNIYDAEQLHE